MNAIRQDAWSADDDLILAEVTLRHIREGSTQLTAFEEVGERIGRTAAACGFRWNSFVRKNYEAAIQLAKAQRQKRSQMRKQGAHAQTAVLEPEAHHQVKGMSAITEESISIDAVIRYLKSWKGTYQDVSKQIKGYQKELQEKDEELARLRKENQTLRSQVNSVETDYQVVNDDYRALIQIMERARKLAFLSEEEQESRTKFKMDANGNLERVE
jgi:prespore-specific regulator